MNTSSFDPGPVPAGPRRRRTLRSLALWIACCSLPASAADTRLFNAMLYTGMPSIGERMIVVYEQAFFSKGAGLGGRLPTEEGLAEAVANAEAQRAGARERGMEVAPVVALDIGRWPVWPFVTVEEHLKSVADYADTARRFKEASGQDVCLYRVFPGGGIAVATRAEREEALREEWLDVARRSWKLLEGVIDAACPQLYTFYDGEEGDARDAAIAQWRGSVDRTLEVAAEIAPDLPVYPFLWPQFAEGGGITGEPFLSAEYWRAEIEHLDGRVEGLILWGGFDRVAKTRMEWDEKAPWWQATVDVLGPVVGGE